MLRSINSNIKFYFLIFNISKTQLSLVICFSNITKIILIIKSIINHNYKLGLHSPRGKEVLGNSFEVSEIMISERKDQLHSSPSLTDCLCVSPVVNRRDLEL